jgi:hypothetical protein
VITLLHKYVSYTKHSKMLKRRFHSFNISLYNKIVMTLREINVTQRADSTLHTPVAGTTNSSCAWIYY